MAYSSLKIDLRRDRILEMLRQEGRVYVSRLSQQLGATPVTIRNDLSVLERDGRLQRVPGGAVPLARAAEAQTVGEVHAAEKRAIAARVAEMVHDGDRLMLNSGTTTLAVAEALKVRRGLHIVTNAIAVAQLLGAEPSFRVLLLGGAINVPYGFLTGGDAQEQLGRYQADWAVLAVDSVSAAGGVTTYHPEEAILNRLMIDRSHRTLIVADHSKIGRAGFAQFHAADADVALVTDAQAPEAERQKLKKQGVEIIIA